MITFDRLKLVTSAKYATNFSQSNFLEVPRKQGGCYYKYQQEEPFFLTIIICPSLQYMTIEYTGKILLDDYPNLINKNNIYDCFERIRNMRICDLDVEAIIHDSRVCVCDVTKDVVCSYDMKDMKDHIKASIINHDKWILKKCQNNGLEIFNSVTTTKRYKRLIIYDKSKELKRAENKRFIATLKDPERLQRYFEGKVRFEYNLRSMGMIREALNIPNNDLLSVLNATTNPILNLFDAVAEETLSNSHKIYNMADKLALLELCHYDLQAVEMRIRANTPKTSSIRRKMEPYRKILQEIQDQKPTINIRNLLE